MRIVLSKLEPAVQYIHTVINMIDNGDNNCEIMVVCSNNMFRERLYQSLCGIGLQVRYISADNKHNHNQNHNHNHKHKQIILANLSDTI